MDHPEKATPESQSSWIDLTYHEVVDHINWIRDPDVEDDSQVYYLNLVDSSLPGADVSDLIFWPNHWFKDEEMLDVDLSDQEIAGYLMAWTGKRLVGAELIELPIIPTSKCDDPPAVIAL